MDRREALRQQFAGQPLELLEHALKLEAELSATQARLAEVEAQLAEAQTYIEELQRRLSGNQSESLSPEQEHKLDQLRKDLQEQAQRPGPLSQQVLEEERQPAERRSRSHRPRFPVSLESETVTLEPETTTCPHCGRGQDRIGEELTEELDWVPAKLIRRRIVRPKYACRCSESSVAIAPLPPRLIPQSKLGLGLAVSIVLTRFDDHLSFYRLEQIFAERYDVVIPRQQMVQWIEHIASG